MGTDVTLASSVRAFCAHIAKNRLLVQAAGGNVSWKEDDRLWIKASGTWLAHAEQSDIFVPVDLVAVQAALLEENFSFAVQALPGYTLRPSIETLLHALLPQPVVVHLHPVHCVTWLTLQDCAAILEERLAAYDLEWTWVDYHRPGVDLARAVHVAMRRQPCASVVFLQNHGVILGCATACEAAALLSVIETALAVQPRTIVQSTGGEMQALVDFAATAADYALASDPSFHLLARNVELFHSVCHHWALCPDHVVFLGASALCIADTGSLRELLDSGVSAPFLFVRDIGVLQHRNASPAQCAQLLFYLDVLLRQPRDAPRAALSAQQISSLLNWDAEKYRILLNQTTA